MVYVQNINGLPLMPSSEAKARHLLEEHRAVIVNYTPFTIRLNFVVDDITQPVTLGVDAGYKTIGLSAATETKVLFEAEFENPVDVKKHVGDRCSLRRGRRHRNTRYRAPRFNNRRRPDGWLPPFVEMWDYDAFYRFLFYYKFFLTAFSETKNNCRWESII